MCYSIGVGMVALGYWLLWGNHVACCWLERGVASAFFLAIVGYVMWIVYC